MCCSFTLAQWPVLEPAPVTCDLFSVLYLPEIIAINCFGLYYPEFACAVECLSREHFVCYSLLKINTVLSVNLRSIHRILRQSYYSHSVYH